MKVQPKRIALFLVDACPSLCCVEHTLNCLFFSLFAGAPPAKRANRSQDECNRETPTDEVLHKLSQDIIPFWKDLGRKLKVPNEKIDEIHIDNVQYQGVSEKAFQMLRVWKEQRSDVAKITELSRALKALGKDRTEMKYCSGSSFMDYTAI